MRRRKKGFVWISLVLAACSALHAQREYERVNSNLGVVISAPLNPTAQFVNIGAGVVAGAGYNFSRHHSVIGEFMWNRLSPVNGALLPIRVAAQDNSISGHSNLFALTGNYRYQLQGKVFGAYFIGGGGWYYRTVGFSKQVTSGTGTVCVPPWVWWGFTCVSGIVVANQTVASSNSGAFGGNAGIGFTVKVADPSYRLYVEPRYHYAPTGNVNTQLIAITVGIRY
jgi:hypothetical protein